MPLTFKTLALEHVSLETLIEFREREVTSNSGDYQALRHRYLAGIEQHLMAIRNYPIGSADRDELDRIFEDEMEKDLRDLKDELRVARNEALLSKDTIALALAGAALGLAAFMSAHLAIPDALTLSGAPASIGGVLGVASKFSASRRNVLRDHPMAYLYEIERAQ